MVKQTETHAARVRERLTQRYRDRQRETDTYIHTERHRAYRNIESVRDRHSEIRRQTDRE